MSDATPSQANVAPAPAAPRREKLQVGALATLRGRLPALSKQCPRCSNATALARTPLRIRPLQWILMDHVTYRFCRACGWRGTSIHREPTRSIRVAERRHAMVVSFAVVIRIVVALLLFGLPAAVIVLSQR